MGEGQEGRQSSAATIQVGGGGMMTRTRAEAWRWKTGPCTPSLLPQSPGRPACPCHLSGCDTRPLHARDRVNDLIHTDRPGVTACEVYPKSKVVFLRV